MKKFFRNFGFGSAAAAAVTAWIVFGTVPVGDIIPAADGGNIFRTTFSYAHEGEEELDPEESSDHAEEPGGEHSDEHADEPVTGNHGANVFVALKEGSIRVIGHSPGNELKQTLPFGSEPAGMAVSGHNFLFVTFPEENTLAVLDPVDDPVVEIGRLSVGTRPGNVYRNHEDPTLIWVMNDGDPDTGNDPIHCEDAGSSVTVIQNHGKSSGELPSVIRTNCVGRGLHEADFSYPTPEMPSVPHRMFVTNRLDGTVSVVNTDPMSANWLKGETTIDLCDPARESFGVCDDDPATGNEAAPTGAVYSAQSGKVYAANSGYGTVSVIDPASNQVETVLDVGAADRIALSRDGRFVVAAGTDLVSDPEHVLGRITVMDVSNHLTESEELPDAHPSDFLFTVEGDKLYVSTASRFATEAQKANLKSGVVYAFETSNLPSLVRKTEIDVGPAGGDTRDIELHVKDGTVSRHLFVAEPETGGVTVISVETDSVDETIDLGGEPVRILVLPLEGDLSHG